MDGSPPDYRREFLRSPHHAALGLLTLGLGFASGSFLGLIVGVAAYAIGWVHLPDLPFFRRFVDHKGDAARQAAATAQLAGFVRRRDALLGALTEDGRQRYRANLARYAEAVKTGQWPCYPEVLDYIGVPHYALKGWSDGD